MFFPMLLLCIYTYRQEELVVKLQHKEHNVKINVSVFQKCTLINHNKNLMTTSIWNHQQIHTNRASASSIDQSNWKRKELKKETTNFIATIIITKKQTFGIDKN